MAVDEWVVRANEAGNEMVGVGRAHAPERLVEAAETVTDVEVDYDTEPVLTVTTCGFCEGPIKRRRATRRYCSNVCRQRAYRTAKAAA